MKFDKIIKWRHVKHDQITIISFKTVEIED